MPIRLYKSINLTEGQYRKYKSENMTDIEIADMYYVSLHSIVNWKAYHHIRGKAKTTKFKLSVDVYNKLIKYGLSKVKISQRYGICRQTLWRWEKRNKIKNKNTTFNSD